MTERIDYETEKYSFTEATESSRLRGQWADVITECRELKAGPQERLRIALLNVDYVTSFELPFRLLLLRTPQLIASVKSCSLVRKTSSLTANALVVFTA